MLHFQTGLRARMSETTEGVYPMGTELAVIEPIRPPDVQRPAKLTMLPPWVQQRCDSLKRASQPDKQGIYREVPILPPGLILDLNQKLLVEQHVAALDDVLKMTPAEDTANGVSTLTTVTKMTMALPSKETGDMGGDAKGEAYMAALEDVPSWAVQEAMRRWYRAECGEKYDYIWQPGPSTLRAIAMTETYRVMAVRRKLNELLLAEPIREFTPEQEAAMKKKIEEYLKRSAVALLAATVEESK
jgi:hypothetical protein